MMFLLEHACAFLRQTLDLQSNHRVVMRPMCSMPFDLSISAKSNWCIVLRFGMWCRITTPLTQPPGVLFFQPIACRAWRVTCITQPVNHDVPNATCSDLSRQYLLSLCTSVLACVVMRSGLHALDYAFSVLSLTACVATGSCVLLPMS